MNIVEAIHDKALFGQLFRDFSTWQTWIAALKAIFALSMNNEELALYRQCTGRQEPLEQPFREVYFVCGRRSGKSFITSLIGIYLAVFQDYSPYLAHGERATLLILATDKKQSQIIMRYVKAILNLPLFRSYVTRETSEVIELSNSVDICIKPCSFKAVRGLTLIGVVFEELSFWKAEGVSIDYDVYQAVRPATMTIPTSMLIGISTPYSKTGLLYEMFKEHYGQEDSETLIWKAPSIVMNPTLSEKMISKEKEKDLSAARAEWDAEFREDIEAFLPLEVIERVVIPGRIELPYLEKFSYQAFVDPAGGGGDSFALSIGHKENGKVIQDVLRTRKGEPHLIVKEYAELLKKYKVHKVTGDKYAGAWVSESFRNEGISYNPSELNKSELYLEALPYISSGMVELIDSKELVKELRLLERRRGSSGKDSVDHPKSIGGGVPHDDASNVSCGIITMANQQRATPGFFFAGRSYERETKEEEKKQPSPNIRDRFIDRFDRGD
jgi:hypothetical protein